MLPPEDRLERALLRELAAVCEWGDALAKATEGIVWARAATAIAAGVSVEHVAEVLGCSRATVYRHLALTDQDKDS